MKYSIFLAPVLNWSLAASYCPEIGECCLNSQNNRQAGDVSKHLQGNSRGRLIEVFSLLIGTN